MPNQKVRKKKDGVNKGKKLRAMREKQASTNPDKATNPRKRSGK
jgi:hypothetical protein